MAPSSRKTGPGPNTPKRAPAQAFAGALARALAQAEPVPTSALALLAQAGFRRPEDALRHLHAFTAPLRPRPCLAFLRALFAALPKCPDPDQAVVNLRRFAEARFTSPTAHKLATFPTPALGLLVRVFGTSQFMANLLINHPEHFDWLAADADLPFPRTPRAFLTVLTDALHGIAAPDDRRRAAIRTMRRELLRLGVRRIMGLSDEMEMARELSDLAQATLQLALAEVTPPLIHRFGHPMEETDADSAASQRRAGFAVIGMGKLGGRELNFSSDIDLIFIYSDEGQTTGLPGGAGRITNHAFFTRLAEALTAWIMAPGAEGYFYRVDTRLRPDGETAPLARSLGSCEIYYTTQARLWERLALLKARAVAGDEGLGRTFEAMSRPLVFDPLHSHELILQVADLKQRIDQEIARRAGAGREVKRGAGGIRELEFLVQTLQMLHGAANPRFWTPETLAAIRVLSHARLLDPEQARRMAEDYLFLRTIEHRLQMAELRQTHMIPEDPAALDALALACGLPLEGEGSPGERLMARWAEVSARVHADFVQFFEHSQRAAEQAGQEFASELTPAALAATPGDEAGQAATLILSAQPESAILPQLAPWGITSGGALKVLRRLGGMGRTMLLTTEGALAYRQLLPVILHLLQTNPQPEVALSNLESFLYASGAVAGYYTTFLRNRPVFELLMLAFGSGSALAQTLIAHPEFLDIVAGARAFAPEENRREPMRRLLAQWLRGRDALPEFCRVLARLKRLEFLLAGLGELAGLLDYPASCDRLGAAATVIIEESLARAARDMGLPAPVPGFAVLAMGKLGAGELNYYSDLDLIFVWDEGFAAGLPAPGEAASALAARVVEILSHPTPEGAPFTIDTRLRPEGQNAPLAPSLGRYLEYYASGRAQTWEFQSAMKLCPIAGDEALARRLAESLGTIISEKLMKIELGNEIRTMRRRMEEALKLPRWVALDFKTGPGGTVDLEFIAQYLQLTLLKKNPTLMGLGPLRVFERLAGEGRLDPALASELVEDYLWLRRLERRARLLFASDKSQIPASGDKLATLERACASLLAERPETNLLEAVQKVLRRNRRHFEEMVR